MWNTKPTRSEQMIYKKRNYEEKLGALKVKLNQEFHEKEFAHWQNRTQAIQTQQLVEQRVQAARMRARQHLNQRRYSPVNADSSWLSC